MSAEKGSRARLPRLQDCQQKLLTKLRLPLFGHFRAPLELSLLAITSRRELTISLENFFYAKNFLEGKGKIFLELEAQLGRIFLEKLMGGRVVGLTHFTPTDLEKKTLKAVAGIFFDSWDDAFPKKLHLAGEIELVQAQLRLERSWVELGLRVELEGVAGCLRFLMPEEQIFKI